jgi:hypothetical protein
VRLHATAAIMPGARVKHLCMHALINQECPCCADIQALPSNLGVRDSPQVVAYFSHPTQPATNIMPPCPLQVLPLSALLLLAAATLHISSISASHLGHSISADPFFHGRRLQASDAAAPAEEEAAAAPPPPVLTKVEPAKKPDWFPIAPVLDENSTWPVGLAMHWPFYYADVWCLVDPYCTQFGPTLSDTRWHSDITPFMQHLKTWPKNIAADQDPTTDAIILSTGIVEYIQEATYDGYICNATYPCVIQFTLPLEPSLLRVDNKTAQRCYRMDVDSEGSLVLVDNKTEIATGVVIGDKLVCHSTKNGLFVAVQYTRKSEKAKKPHMLGHTIHRTTDGTSGSTSHKPARSGTKGGSEPASAATPAAEAHTCPWVEDWEYVNWSDGSLRVTGSQVMLLTFSFALDYNSMFYPRGAGYAMADYPAILDFNVRARKSIIRHIANKTKLHVYNDECGLEVGRLKSIATYSGSVITEMSFLVPHGTTKEQTDELSKMLSDHTAEFFQGPFEEKYGQVHVRMVQRHADPLNEDIVTVIAAVAVIGVSIITMGAMVWARKIKRKKTVRQMSTQQSAR